MFIKMSKWNDHDFCHQSHRTKLPYFRNELVEKSVNGQNWQTGQSYLLAIYVYENPNLILQMMAFYMRKISGGCGIRTHHDLLPWFIILLLLRSDVGVISGGSNWGNLYQVTLAKWVKTMDMRLGHPCKCLKVPIWKLLKSKLCIPG